MAMFLVDMRVVLKCDKAHEAMNYATQLLGYLVEQGKLAPEAPIGTTATAAEPIQLVMPRT